MNDYLSKLDAPLGRLRDFATSPPSHLEITVDGSPVRFPIEAGTGKVGQLPERGVWDWARGLRWRDLEEFLRKKGYEVRAVRDVAVS